MSIRKLIAEDLGAAARQRRIERYRKKLAPEAALESMADADEAIDKAALPDASKMGKGGVSITITKGIEDTANDADKWDEENKAALAALEDDEEDAKWMAKQRG